MSVKMKPHLPEKKSVGSVEPTEKPSPEEDIERNFISVLQASCSQEGIKVIPEMFVITEKGVLEKVFPAVEQTEDAKDIPSGVIHVGFDVPDKRETPQKVIFKGVKMNVCMQRAIMRSITVNDSSITVLKLERCSLTDNMLYRLAVHLSEIKHIQDLSLDGNPVPSKDYSYFLTMNIKLQYLSLRYCLLEDYGVSLLAKVLRYKESSNQYLLSLNLNCNRISCNGAYLIAEALRKNRSLASLSLAGNFIADDGVLAIANILQKFQLNDEEIKVLRTKKIKRLKQRNELIHQKIQKTKSAMILRESPPTAVPQKRRTSRLAKRKPFRESMKSSAAESSMTSTATTTADKFGKGTLTLPAQEMSRIEKEVDREMELDSDPYITEVKIENKSMFCDGNFRLNHLNLAYNHIGIDIVQKFMEIVQYQEIATANSQFPGLVRLVLQGKHIPKNNPELLKLTEQVNNRLENTRKESTTIPLRKAAPQQLPAKMHSSKH